MNSTTTLVSEKINSNDDEFLLLVDKDVACLPLGFSFDAGGSIFKLVYRSKKDYHNGELKDVDSPHGKLRLRYIRNNDVDGLIEFLQNNCDILEECWNKSKRVWYQTGCYGHQLLDSFSEKLNISIQIIGEADLQGIGIRGFYSKKSSSDIYQQLRPISTQSTEKARKLTLVTKNTVESIKSLGDESFSAMMSRRNVEIDLVAYHNKLTTMSSEELAADMSLTDVEYPCILVVIGSVLTLCLLGENGSSVALDILSLSAKAFVNIGLELTGAKDYHELVEMIGRGKPEKVHLMVGDEKKSPVPDWYSVWPSDMLLFAFAKLGDKNYDGKYSKDDVAAAWAQTFCLNTAKIVSLYCTVHNIQSVLFGGSFIVNSILRECMEECFMINSLMLPFTGWHRIRMTSLPHPGFIGALGTWFYNYEQDPNGKKMKIKS